MQTDSDRGNFCTDPATKKTSLIDFGATREFPNKIIDGYLRIVWASLANQDERRLADQSQKMGNSCMTGDKITP